MPVSVFGLQKQPGDGRNFWKGLKQLTPHLLTFTHHPDIKFPVSKEKFIFRRDLGAAHHNCTGGEKTLDLCSQKEASFHIPLVTT
jgi:hypothetical protein